MRTLYGIKNCDTVKKALAHLSERGLPHSFHDYKRSGLDEATLCSWIQAVGWEVLLNTRGTTWRGLTESERTGVDETKARQLMLRHTSLIKRPVLVDGTRIVVGFKAGSYDGLSA